EQWTSASYDPIAHELDLTAFRRPPDEDRNLVSRNAERRQIDQLAKLRRGMMLALQNRIDEGDQRGPLRRGAARRSFHQSGEENAHCRAQVRFGEHDPFIGIERRADLLLRKAPVLNGNVGKLVQAIGYD